MHALNKERGITSKLDCWAPKSPDSRQVVIMRRAGVTKAKTLDPLPYQNSVSISCLVSVITATGAQAVLCLVLQARGSQALRKGGWDFCRILMATLSVHKHGRDWVFTVIVKSWEMFSLLHRDQDNRVVGRH
jgi:hypothetical protein